jgi:hypothetical protein
MVGGNVRSRFPPPSAMGTLQNLAKVGFTAGEILCLHFPAIGSQLDSLNQPGVHHGKLI